METEYIKQAEISYERSEADRASERLHSYLYEMLAGPPAPAAPDWKPLATLVQAGKLPSSDSPAMQAAQSAFSAELSALTPGHRAGALADLPRLETSVAELISARAALRQLVRSNNFKAAESEQHATVKSADAIPRRLLGLEHAALVKAMKAADDPQSRQHLKERMQTVENLMAAPFTERVLLAAMQIQQEKLSEAERTLSEAVAVELPLVVQDGKPLSEMRRFAETKRQELQITRTMPDFVERHLASLDTNSDRFLHISELKQAAASNRFSGVDKGTIEFLLTHYDVLRNASNDEWFAESSGVSLRDVHQYHSSTRPGQRH